MGGSQPGSPAVCDSKWRTSTPSLPAWANSGQYVATGASTSSSPRSASTSALSAVIVFVVDHTLTIVSRSHGAVISGSIQPAHTSATTSPSTTTHALHPTSCPESIRLPTASRTPTNLSSQLPPTSAMRARYPAPGSARGGDPLASEPAPDPVGPELGLVFRVADGRRAERATRRLAAAERHLDARHQVVAELDVADPRSVVRGRVFSSAFAGDDRVGDDVGLSLREHARLRRADAGDVADRV